MRTVTKNFIVRLGMQAEEAEDQNLTKLADTLTSQISKNIDNVRDDDDFYSYADAEMKADVNEALWDAVVRIADYLGQTPDAAEVQGILNKYANDLINEMCECMHVPDGVGAYESNVPGEVRSHIAISVKDKE